MSMSAKEIKEWLAILDENAEVGIDDSGLCLRVAGEPSYLEIGGIEEVQAFALPEPKEGGDTE